MTAYIEGALSLKAVAAVTKRTIADVEAEALSLGMFLGADWAGRPAVAERDAQQLVTGEARRVREHDLAWRDFEDRSRAWEATRDAVGGPPMTRWAPTLVLARRSTRRPVTRR